MNSLLIKFLLSCLCTLTLVQVFSGEGYSYRLQANTDTLRMTARSGDTAMAYILLSDGRDSTARPLGRASFYVFGNNGCQIAGPRSIMFSGTVSVPIVYTGGHSSQGNLSISSDSGTITIVLIGTTSGTSNVDLTKPTSPPVFDSIHIGKSKCYSWAITNRSGGPSDSITISNIWIDPGSQSSVQFSLTGLPPLPCTIAWYKVLAFQGCAMGIDTNDPSWLIGTLHVAYSTKTGSDSSIWPIFGGVIPLDTRCMYIGGGGSNMGAVSEGDTITKTNVVVNETDSSIVIDSVRFIDGDLTRFQFLAPSLPFTVAPRSQDTIRLQYSVPSPSPAAKYGSTLEFWPRGTSRDNVACGPYMARITGSLLIPIVDTIELDIPGGDTSTLQISTHLIHSLHALDLRNTGSTNLILDQIDVLDTTGIAWLRFEGLREISFRDTLAATQEAWSSLLLEVPDTGTYEVDILVTYHNALTSHVFKLLVHRPAQAQALVAGSLPKEDEFVLTPNPAHNEVTIVLPSDHTSVLEIYDVLGNLIARHDATGHVMWDGKTTSGYAPSGTYLVRVSDCDSDGMFRARSKRLLFSR